MMWQRLNNLTNEQRIIFIERTRLNSCTFFQCMWMCVCVCAVTFTSSLNSSWPMQNPFRNWQSGHITISKRIEQKNKRYTYMTDIKFRSVQIKKEHIKPSATNWWKEEAFRLIFLFHLFGRRVYKRYKKFLYKENEFAFTDILLDWTAFLVKNICSFSFVLLLFGRNRS